MCNSLSLCSSVANLSACTVTSTHTISCGPGSYSEPNLYTLEPQKTNTCSALLIFLWEVIVFLEHKMDACN